MVEHKNENVMYFCKMENKMQMYIDINCNLKRLHIKVVFKQFKKLKSSKMRIKLTNKKA